MTWDPVEDMKKLQVNHKDENKKNNCLDNLEWMICKENINYGTGIQRGHKTTDKKHTKTQQNLKPYKKLAQN